MEKIRIQEVLECNKVLFKIMEQRTTFPISVGLKLNKIMKMFDEVEEYVFTLMDMTFQNINWENLTKEEITFYNKVVSEEIELDFDKISKEVFENNDKLMLTLEDIDNLSLIIQ